MRPPGDAESPSPDAESAADAAPADIDLVKLNDALRVSCAPAPPPEADRIEEIADDLQHLMQRVHVLEQGQTEMLARLDALVEAVRTSAHPVAVEVDGLRRDLLGDRRIHIDRHVFNALAPALDALEEMRDGLGAEAEVPIARQLAAVISIAGNALQRLGYARFEARPGDPFDPARMEALGVVNGRPGAVVAALRPGYLWRDVVERPAGVLVARPAGEGSEEPPDPPPSEEVS